MTETLSAADGRGAHQAEPRGEESWRREPAVVRRNDQSAVKSKHRALPPGPSPEENAQQRHQQDKQDQVSGGHECANGAIRSASAMSMAKSTARLTSTTTRMQEAVGASSNLLVGCCPVALALPVAGIHE